MEKIIIDIEAKTDKAAKGLDKVAKELQEVNKEVVETTKSSKELSAGLDKATGGSVTKFKGLQKALKTTVVGFKSLRIAIASTGLGLLLIALVSIKKAFTSSEEGQNKFAKIMGVISAITQVFTDRLADLGELLIDLFTNPVETLKDFGKAINDFVVDKIEKAVKGIGLFGSAISKVFQGNFSGALTDAKDGLIELNKATNPLVIATDALAKSTKKLVGELTREGKIAQDIADKRAKADKVDRKNIVDRAKANQKISELRFKAEQRDKFSTQERIDFLKEASKLEEETTNKEIQSARLRFEAKKLENSLGKSTKEDKEEEANLEAQLISLTTSKLNLQKRLQTSITSFQNEQKTKQNAEKKRIEDENKAEQKKLDDAAKKEKERIQKSQEELQKIRDELKAKEDSRIERTEEEKVNVEREKALKEIENIKLTEEQKRQTILDVNAYYDELEKEAKDKDDAERLAKEKKLADAKIKIAENEAEAKKQNLAKVSNALSSFSEIAGKETAAGKALAIASTLIQTYQSAQSSYASLASIPIVGPALGVAASGAAIFSGMKQIQNIKKTKVPNGGGGGGNVPTPTPASAPNIPSVPPSFNVVGGGATNQLAEAIGGQSQQPVQAYVVANDVTTSQSLDRNIVEGASI